MDIASSAGENLTSQLKPSRKWLYLALDKQYAGRKGYAPRVVVIQATWTLQDFIEKRTTEVDPENPEMLANGPAFSFDILMTKTVRKDLGKRFGTSYSPRLYQKATDSPGQYPIMYDLDSVDLTQHFTEAELRAIEECPWDLEKMAQALSEDETREVFQKYPLFLGAVNFSSSKRLPIFRDPKSLVETLDALDITYVMSKEDFVPTSDEDKQKVTQARTVSLPISRRRAKKVVNDDLEDAEETPSSSAEPTPQGEPKAAANADDDEWS